MEQQILIWLIVGIIIGVVIGYLIAKIYFWMKLRKVSKSSVQKSRSVLLGQVNEQIAPLLPDFPYNFKDAMFMGKGVDYIIFDGLNDGYIDEIVFLEVKSGKSGLNRNERLIKDAIQKRRVSYEIMRIN